jgi:hypothetical protein
MAIGANVKFTNDTFSNFCSECKGKLWSPDQSTRQANALKAFGTIPNNCVNGSAECGNTSHCPYHK